MHAYPKVAAFLIAGALLSTDALAAGRYSEWGEPVNLGCDVINTPSTDAGPGISKDGLSLYFHSNRPSLDPMTPADLYVAQRASSGAPWSEPQNLGDTVNSAFADSVPSLSRDGHWLFFNSNRPGGYGDVDIWASYRPDVHNDFAWQTPVNLGPGVNTGGFEAGASYWENEEGSPPLLFFGRGATGTSQGTTSDIYVSEQLPDGSFGTAQPVSELNLPPPNGEQRPSIRFDGLEMFFFSNRAPGFGRTDLWVTRRKDVHDAWDPPVNLGQVVNTTFGEFNPHISADGMTLYFARTDGPCGGFDLYKTTRTKLKGAVTG